MVKKIFLLLLIIIVCVGCSNYKNVDSNKIFLSDMFYNKGNFIEIDSKSLEDYSNKTYLLFTYNNFCSLPISCEKIFKSFASDYKIDFLSMPFSEFKNTYLYDTVKYAPSVLIVENNKIIAYLDANKDDDLEKYQDVNKFKDWLNNYINISK